MVAVNRESLLALLDRGVKIEYFDHHFVGELPKRAGLDAYLDASALLWPLELATSFGRSMTSRHSSRRTNSRQRNAAPTRK